MASNWTVCGVCDSQEITKPSVIWCSECDEGLCAECDKHHAVSKASRTHSTIPIAKYKQLPTDVLKITHTCSKHNEKYQIYCRKHDCPCCHRCVIDTHNDCKDITAIDDIIKGVKSSNALSDIEQILVELAENLEKITKYQEDNLKSVKDQRSAIEKEIQQTRIKINSHLDQIQEDLIKDLNIKEETERKKIEDFLTSLEKKKKEINVHKTTLLNIKQHASEFQTYLVIKQIETKLNIEERFVENFASSDNLMRIALSLKDDKTFQTISNLKSFGEIKVEMRSSEILMTRMKGIQAQFEVVNVLPQSVEKIKLNLKRTIKTGLSNVKGCLILPDGRLILSCRDNNLVRVFNSDGTYDFDIILTTCNVIDMTFIPENNTIAATSGGEGSHNIILIDIENRKIIKKTKVYYPYFGIAYNDTNLIACARSEGLHILTNDSNKTIDEIKIKQMSIFSYVAAFDNKLYYTCKKAHYTVTCCDNRGTDIWTFKDTSVLKLPKGITVDNGGNVYVAITNSCKVIVISSDGKRHYELLSANDGLSKPTVLDYDRSRHLLLVGNQTDTALLYQVTGNI